MSISYAIIMTTLFIFTPLVLFDLFLNKILGNTKEQMIRDVIVILSGCILFLMLALIINSNFVTNILLHIGM